MASIGASARQEWEQLKHDPPGRRFQNHRERMKQHSTVLAIGRALLGLVLFGAGVVMLFIPGPGLLAMVFGLALLAGMSMPLARLMDRAEPPIRRGAHRVTGAWHGMSRLQKAGAILIVVGLVGLFGVASYRVLFT